MLRKALDDLRKSCFWMSVFASFFVFMYLGVVLLTKFMFVYFSGFVPDIDPNIFRALFYPLAALSVWAAFFIKKRRDSVERLKAAIAKKPDEVIKYLLITFIISVTLAFSPLICGFFMFFLGAMFIDFYILAAVSLALVFTSIPKPDFLEERIKDALKG